MSDKNELSLGKWAEKWNVPAKELQKQVISPTSKKGNCSYYSEEALAPVKKDLK